MSGLLRDVRVLDFTRVISGPTATQYMADMGAEVVKVEPPRSGDVMRHITPLKNGVSGFFVSLNRGKKSITLDLKNPRGKEIALRLADRADVLVENFSPGTMDDLGLGWEVLRERNPRLVYASLSGYGQYGPASREPAYDLCVQAACGLMSMNGHSDRPPCRIGFSVTDYFAGVLLGYGVMGALLHRERTGEGQLVDVSMFDAGLTLLENAIPRYDMLGEVARPVGSRHPAASPHNVYRTRDGHIALIAIEDGNWRRLCRAMGRPELVDDPELGTALSRLDHVDRVDAELEAWTTTRTTAEIVEVLTEHRVPYGIVRDAADLLDDPHALARDMVVTVEQPGYGPLRVPGNPIKLSMPGSRARVRGPAPALGEHTTSVLGELLGLDDEEIRALEADGAI